MKIFRKITFVSLILCLLLTLVINLAPSKVHAASALEQRISDRLQVEALDKCVDDLSEELPTGELQTPFGEFNEADKRMDASNKGVSVGYVVASDDGKWICGTLSHANNWFKLIGYDGYKDFRDTEYKPKGDYLEAKDGRDGLRNKVRRKINDARGRLPLRNEHRYFIYLTSFEKCTVGPQTNRNDVEGRVITINNFIAKDGSKIDKAYFGVTEEDEISVGHGFGPADGRLKCDELADKLKDRDLANAYKDWAADNAEDVAAIAASETASDDSSCEANTGVMSWIGCPIIEILGGALNWVDTQVSRLLEIDINKVSSDQMYNAWSRFRNISLSLLIIAMLVVVISTALGLSVLDAYTAKKAFPKMIIAIIFTLLSWWLCIFLIDFFNALGRGILGLMTQPFPNTGDLTTLFSPSAAQGGLGIAGILIGGGALAFVPGAIGILASWLGAGLLIMGIAFLTLIARQMFIIVLVLMSPIAILSWIFPNTDKAWKFWWGTFSKLLLMYPMVMALIGAGRIFASVIATGPSSGGEGLLNPLLKLTAYVLPYLFIPFTFKAAGGVFGNLAGMANDRSKGAFDRLRKGRQKNYAQIGHNAKTGNLVRGTGGFSNAVNTRTQRAAHLNKAGLRPGRMRANIDNAVGTTDKLEAERQAKENAEYSTWSGNDTLNRFATESTNEAELRQAMVASGDYVGREDQMERDISRVERLRRETSPEVFRTLTHKNATKGGTAFDTSSEWLRSAIAASGDDDAALADLISTGRSDLMSAGRVDQGGAGFGETLRVARALRDGNMTDAQANAAIHRNVIESQGPGVIAHASMKPGAVRELVPEIRERLAAAHATGNQDLIDRELAIVSSMYDSMAASSPQNARILGDGVMNWDISSGVNAPIEPVATAGAVANSVQTQVEARRQSQVYQTTRRELNSQQTQIGQIGGGAAGNAPPPTTPAANP